MCEDPDGITVYTKDRPWTAGEPTDAVLGDKAYSSRATRAHQRARGIEAVIAEPDDQKRRRGGRCGRSAGVVLSAVSIWLRSLTRIGGAS